MNCRPCAVPASGTPLVWLAASVIEHLLLVHCALMNKLKSMQRWCPPLFLAALLLWRAAFAGLAPAKEDIIFLVDNSMIMKKIDKEVTLPGAIQAFAEGISRDVRVALILFDDNATLEVSFVPVNGKQLDAFVQGLASIDYKDRFSNSAAAVERALHELQSDGRSGAGKSIILFTHGNIDTGNEALDLNFSKWMSSVLAEDAAQARIRIFCAAFPGTEETSILEDLAQRTGGMFHPVTEAGELSSLFDSLGAVIFSNRAAASPD